jgi:hypothetical protein
MTASGPGCVKTRTRGECAELFSLSSSFDDDRQSGSFLIRRNRDKLSTRKFGVGVFTQPGSKTDFAEISASGAKRSFIRKQHPVTDKEQLESLSVWNMRGILSFLAAKTRPWPMTTRDAWSTTIGTTNPNSRILSAIWSICRWGCCRGLRGFQSEITHRAILDLNLNQACICLGNVASIRSRFCFCAGWFIHFTFLTVARSAASYRQLLRRIELAVSGASWGKQFCRLTAIFFKFR